MAQNKSSLAVLAVGESKAEAVEIAEAGPSGLIQIWRPETATLGSCKSLGFKVAGRNRPLVRALNHKPLNP